MSFISSVPVINSIKVEPDLIATKQTFLVKASVSEELAVLYFVQNYSGEISSGQKNYPRWAEDQAGIVYVDGTKYVNGNGTYELPYNDLFYAMNKAGENGTVIVIGNIIFPTTIYVDGTADFNGDGTLESPYNDLFLGMYNAGRDGTVIAIGDVTLQE